MQYGYIYDGEHSLCMLKERLPADNTTRNQEMTTFPPFAKNAEDGHPARDRVTAGDVWTY